MITKLFSVEGGFGRVRLAKYKDSKNSGNISEDIDAMIPERNLKSIKGRKISKSIEHISTTGTSGNNTENSDVVMSNEPEQIEESKFVPNSKAPRLSSPKMQFRTVSLQPKNKENQ